IEYDDPRPPRALNDRVPRDLETVCLKCLQKDPARRYATAAELAGDLRRYLAGRPVLARPAGRVERAGRWARRNPAPAPAGGPAGWARAYWWWWPGWRRRGRGTRTGRRRSSAPPSRCRLRRSSTAD